MIHNLIVQNQGMSEFVFPSSSARFLFFDYCYFYWDTRQESLESLSLERFQRDPAGYPIKNSNNRKIESGRRTMGSDTKVRRRHSFCTAVWAKHVHSSNAAMLDFPPGPTSFAKTLGSRLSSSKVRCMYLLLPWSIYIFREYLLLPWGICFCRKVFASAVSICFCPEVFAFAVRYLLLPWVFAFAVKYLVLPWNILFLL